MREAHEARHVKTVNAEYPEKTVGAANASLQTASEPGKIITGVPIPVGRLTVARVGVV